MTADVPPCRCLDSHDLDRPWHPGHCCLLLPGQTCHRAQVEAWVRQDRAIHGGEQ